MRRGLKRGNQYQCADEYGCFKPIPDEEGTETARFTYGANAGVGFKPIPDEEGTETRARHDAHRARFELQTDPR